MTMVGSDTEASSGRHEARCCGIITIAATSRSWRLSRCQRSRPRLRATWRGGNARRRVLGAAWPWGTLDELAERADPYRDHGHPGPREVALARRHGWPPADGRREGKGLGLYLGLSVKLWPQRIRARVPAPPHAA